MMNPEERVSVLSQLGKLLGEIVQQNTFNFEALCQKAYEKNNWFEPECIKYAATVWSKTLTTENLTLWISSYPTIRDKGVNVGVINAGNIPFAGMHDLLSIFISGDKYIAKNSSDDPYLMPYVVDLLISIEPDLKGYFQFAEKLSGMDAVIATGSNNSSHYFEYYFKKYPHIIRRNRNAVAVLNGKETNDDLKNLAEDIFRYFGLGCRNVSKLYVPKGYDFKNFFESLDSFSPVMQHNKYMNNFDYNNVMLLMKGIPFLQNGFLILREEKQIASPIAVIHYEQYNDRAALSGTLDEAENQIQCVVTNTELNFKSTLQTRTVALGRSQYPSLWDYADGVDTLNFLIAL